MLSSCIAGAILLACSKTAAIHVDGPLHYAASYPAAGAWNYAVYAVPLQAPPQVILLPRRA